MDDDAVYTLELLTQLGHLRAENEWLTRELDEAIKSSTAVCDSYAEENQRLFDRAEAAERQVATLREALDRVLNDIDFMVERRVITDIRNDVIYVRARAALAATEKKDEH